MGILTAGQIGKLRVGRWTRHWIGRSAASILASLLLFHLAGQPRSASNLLTNPSFEEERVGLPAGWNLDQKLRSKGSVRLAQDAYAGARSLELSPNGRNTDAGQLFGVGQLIAARNLTGKRLRLSAAVKASGGATATVIAFAVGGGFKPLNSVVLESSPSTSAFTVVSKVIELDPAAEQVLVACAVKGTSGSALFDNVTFGGEEEAARAVPASSQQEATVTIDAGKTLRTIPRTLYGTNVEWIHNGNGIWDPGAGRLRPEIVAAARALGTSLVRFPGGIFADYYHWRDGIGPLNQRPERPHVADDGRSRHFFGTDELMRFCREIGAEPMLQVNIVTGTPQEAAEWVAYCNRPGHPERTRNGSSAPYNVRYWEIGNEPYGKSEDKKIAASSLTPAEYARRYQAYAAAMKAVDPSIQLVAAGGLNSGQYVAVSDNSWNQVLLDAAASQIDYLAVHNAYAPLWASASKASFLDVYRAQFAFPRSIIENLNAVANQTSRASSNPKKIQLAVTEWGPFFHAIPSDPWVGHTKTMGSALFVASALNAFLRSEQTAIANFFKLTENAFMGWIDPAGNPKANYYALQMYTTHFGTTLVEASATGPSFDSRTVGSAAAVKGAPFLDVVASLNPDRTRLYLIVVNRHDTAALNTSISVLGFQVRRVDGAWRLHASSLDANNGNDLPDIPGLQWGKQVASPDHPMIGKGRPGLVAPQPVSIDASAGSFTHAFPPISITAIELTR